MLRNLKSKHVNVGEARIIIYWWSPSEFTGDESSPLELLEVWRRIPEFWGGRAGVCTQAKEQDPCETSTLHVNMLCSSSNETEQKRCDLVGISGISKLNYF